MTADNPLTAYNWTPQPEAERLIHELVDAFLRRSDFAATLRDRMHREAGVRFVDMVDHIRLASSDKLEHDLAAAGFQHQMGTAPSEIVYVQPGGIFPRVILNQNEPATCLALKVESVADFESVWQTGAQVVGAPLAPLRWAKVWRDAGQEL